jgi:hypothetical protein
MFADPRGAVPLSLSAVAKTSLILLLRSVACCLMPCIFKVTCVYGHS